MARCITYTKHSSDSTLIVVDTSPLPAANIMLRLATQPPGGMVFKRATNQSASLTTTTTTVVTLSLRWKRVAAGI